MDQSKKGAPKYFCTDSGDLPPAFPLYFIPSLAIQGRHTAFQLIWFLQDQVDTIL